MAHISKLFTFGFCVFSSRIYARIELCEASSMALQFSRSDRILNTGWLAGDEMSISSGTKLIWMCAQASRQNDIVFFLYRRVRNPFKNVCSANKRRFPKVRARKIRCSPKSYIGEFYYRNANVCGDDARLHCVFFFCILYSTFKCVFVNWLSY